MMKRSRKKIELLKLTFIKLCKKLKKKNKISDGATYNISLQSKYCEDLEDEENIDYLTRFATYIS